MAAAVPRSGSAAILLTGIGRGGARGMLTLGHAGGHTIAQDEAASVVYGMPQAARQLDAAVEILPFPAIAAATARRVDPAG